MLKDHWQPLGNTVEVALGAYVAPSHFPIPLSFPPFRMFLSFPLDPNWINGANGRPLSTGERDCYWPALVYDGGRERRNLELKREKPKRAALKCVCVREREREREGSCPLLNSAKSSNPITISTRLLACCSPTRLREIDPSTPSVNTPEPCHSLVVAFQVNGLTHFHDHVHSLVSSALPLVSLSPFLPIFPFLPFSLTREVIDCPAINIGTSDPVPNQPHPIEAGQAHDEDDQDPVVDSVSNFELKTRYPDPDQPRRPSISSDLSRSPNATTVHVAADTTTAT